MKSFVYILKCSDGSYYTGYTNNLENRIKKHNQGKASKYTRVRLPVSYVFTYECQDKATALSLEYRIKQLSRSKKERIIDNSLDITSLLDK